VAITGINLPWERLPIYLPQTSAETVPGKKAGDEAVWSLDELYLPPTHLYRHPFSRAKHNLFFSELLVVSQQSLKQYVAFQFHSLTLHFPV
jgi:hypothetical protein